MRDRLGGFAHLEPPDGDRGSDRKYSELKAEVAEKTTDGGTHEGKASQTFPVRPRDTNPGNQIRKISGIGLSAGVGIEIEAGLKRVRFDLYFESDFGKL